MSLMKKEAWIKEAKAYVQSVTGSWETNSLNEYVEDLYEEVADYYEDTGMSLSPEEAVDEDMSYWEND